MISPFKVTYQSQFSTLKNSSDIFLIIENSLIKEKDKSDSHSEDDCLFFTNRFMSRSIFHSIEKGKFSLISNGSQKILTYEFYMYYYFIIYLVINFFIAIYNGSFFNYWSVAFFLYILLVWFCSILSQKLFFKKVVQKIMGKQ
jgi:hypothetical protein